MVASNICYLVVLLLATLLIGGVVVSSHQVPIKENAACDGVLLSIGYNCWSYIQYPGPKTPPSRTCCSIVRNANMPCVCASVTEQEETHISMEKLVYVAFMCGNPLSHGTRCGSKYACIGIKAYN
uniref:Bifunctional inhibitor/plant lipid transfer protein/seed storage helical domain-containing protein n=1 Tax=Nelumbo nucifera TaxID=4432 RepID=A0A822ZLE1_NELNU|nr:TPA_asm: hypothetical protein HUJ06_000798 [Nelumbo nucifera]